MIIHCFDQGSLDEYSQTKLYSIITVDTVST